MNLVEQLTRDEALRLRPYTDTVGKLTIGVGRNLTDKGITRDESDFLLSNDIDEVTEEVSKALPWTKNLDPIRLAVLLNMAFNMGTEGLVNFHHMLAHVQEGKYPDAAQDMLNSKWAHQVGPRAVRLAKQMTSGEWQ